VLVTEFTPIASLVGGLLIGAASVLLMAVRGRIFGATGILAGLLTPADRSDWIWRALLLAGMVTGPIVHKLLFGEMPAIQVPVSTTALIIGGIIVGVGVTYGAGCTSGHGVCGMARLSRRSIMATLTFMVTTGLSVFAVRHLFGGAI